jgi:S1-C subfamily serine protease
MNSYTAEGAFTTPIGMELTEGRRKLDGGEEIDGLVVTEVTKGSPAAIAGLHGYKHGATGAMTGVAVAAAAAFPPAMPALFIAIPLIQYMHPGESYDMIIGVDGSRVTNYLDFADRMHEVRPGEIVYLSVLRDGKRAQMKIYLPPTSDYTW